MASFELKSNSCDGHIRALSRAIGLTTKMSKNASLEFTPDKMRLSAIADHSAVRFVFNKDFFTTYNCEGRHRCFLNTKALQMPFKSLVLMGDKDMIRTDTSVRCVVEDEINNRIVFKVGKGESSTTLTYRISINDLTPEERSTLDNTHRTIMYSRLELSPKQGKKERFLLSAFNNFAPEIDQVTLISSKSEVKFIGSTSLIHPTKATLRAEFTHSRDDFSVFNVREEDMKLTFALKSLKLFLKEVESNRIQLNPSFVFEGVAHPAHFIYECTLFKASYLTQTCIELFPEEIAAPSLLPITDGHDESFIVDDVGDGQIVQSDEDMDQFVESVSDETDDDGYNDNESEEEENLLDGNLERLDTTSASHTAYMHSIESIRNEMRTFQPDPEKVRQILNIDQDPDDIENVQVIYSSDSDDDE